MKMTMRVAIAVAAISVASTPSVAHADTVAANAENIRKLDIMLMVTSLRCRKGVHNFQADYDQFSNTHRTTLVRASSHLRKGLTRRHGAKGAKRALDKMSVGMANGYGRGHPWLGCAQLKQVTRDLTKERDPIRLSASANELLDHRPQSRWAAR